MKRILLSIAALALILGSCQKDASEIKPDQQEIAVDMSDFYVYTAEATTVKSGHVHGPQCGSMKVLNRKLKENPSLENRMYNIEKHTRKLIAAKSTNATSKGKPGGGEDPAPTPYQGSITIPVIVNILEDVLCFS